LEGNYELRGEGQAARPLEDEDRDWGAPRSPKVANNKLAVAPQVEASNKPNFKNPQNPFSLAL